MKKSLLSLASLMFLSAMMPAQAIKKCQDSDGNWHYGDIAVQKCQKTKVTTLNNRGFVTKEKDAPKTEEQLQKEKDELAALELEAANQKARDDERNRILSVYETEADIDRQRDNQVKSVEGSMAVHKAYLKAMTSKVERLEKQGAAYTGGRKDRNQKAILDANTRIDKSTAELKKLDKQKASIIERFSNEKRIYLELKNQG